MTGILLQLFVFVLAVAPLISLADNCKIKELHSVSTEVHRTSFDHMQSRFRDQTVQYSSHRGKFAQKRLTQLFEESKGLSRLSEKERQAFADQLRILILQNQETLKTIREDINRLESMHKKHPFTYIGMELSQQDVNRHLNRNLAMAQQIQKSLRLHMSNHLSEVQIEDILLALMGDEYYLLLPGQIFADLPRYGTEDHDTREQFATLADQCQLVLERYRDAMRGTPVETSANEMIQAFNKSSKVDSKNLFVPARDHFIEALKTHLKPAGSTHLTADVVKRNLKPCDVMFTVERDKAVAENMMTHLPLGRGLIMRGSNHKIPLNRELENFCQRVANQPVPTKVENTSAQGVE